MKLPTKEEFQKILDNLTPLELLSLKEAWISSDSNGHDFGFTEDIQVDGQKPKAMGGVVSSFIKKGIITRDEEFGQFGFVVFGDEKFDYANQVEAHLKQKGILK